MIILINIFWRKTHPQPIYHPLGSKSLSSSHYKCQILSNSSFWYKWSIWLNFSLAQLLQKLNFIHELVPFFIQIVKIFFHLFLLLFSLKQNFIYSYHVTNKICLILIFYLNDLSFDFKDFSVNVFSTTLNLRVLSASWC